MNSLDNHYYDSLDALGQPSYDWERQLINLGCKCEEFDLVNGGLLSGDGLKASSDLVHEYIHFLQNFATAWGAPIFTDFVLAMMKIGASSATSDEHLHVPIDIDKITNALLREGLELNETVSERLNRCDEYRVDRKKILLPLTIDITKDDCAILSNGKLIANLGIKLIREHMAHLGTQMYLRKTDAEIHSYNLKLFVDEGAEFCKKPEYWILFEYIYEQKKFQNIARGIFYLTQCNLVTLNPEKALLRFLTWFETKKISFAHETDFYHVIYTWIESENERYNLHVGLHEAKKHCQKILALSDKNNSKHDLFRFTYNIANYAFNNIDNNNGGFHLFNIKDDFADFNFWRQKIAKYGTGIVGYLNTTAIHGSQKHVEEMTESFYILMSTSIVLKKILKNRKWGCPFFEEIPICKAEYRGSSNCDKNPFLMVMNDGKGEQCLFANGVLLLGMQKRLVFDE